MALVAADDRDIGGMHEQLLGQGILTKSMVKTYLRCPVQFERRYVHGDKEAPGWAMQLGTLFDDLMTAWGRRTLEGNTLPPAEARQLLSDGWDQHLHGIRPDPKDPHKTKDAKIKALQAAYGEWLVKHNTLGLGRLFDIQPGFGYDGKTKLGGTPIAGHPDSVWEKGPADFKCIKSTSPYRSGGLWGNLFDHTFQAVLTQQRNSFLVVFIHDFKTTRNPRMEQKAELVTDHAERSAGEIVHRVGEAIRKGDFPATSMIGKYPCQPNWCGYFGSVCPVTGHLNKEDF